MSILDISLAYALPFGSALAVYITFRIARRGKRSARNSKDTIRKGRNLL